MHVLTFWQSLTCSAVNSLERVATYVLKKKCLWWSGLGEGSQQYPHWLLTGFCVAAYIVPNLLHFTQLELGGLVSVFHCCVKSYKNFSALQQRKLSLSFHESRVQAWYSQVLCSGSHKAVISVSARNKDSSEVPGFLPN